MMSCLLWKSVVVLSLVYTVRGQSSGDVRLVDVSGSIGGTAGRLEFYYDGQWGTVCDDRFGSNDALVACRQLGYTDHTEYGRVGTLGFDEISPDSPTWLDELRCIGTESRLISCPANTIGVEDCTHSQDVALVCTADGDLRLVDNSGQTGGTSGRLEVYYSGQWGTVCEDSFGPNDALVACRQLGFSTYFHYGTVGALDFSQPSSTTPTWLDDLGCLGNESRLINCSANPIGDEDCGHSKDVALVCRTSTSTTSSPSSPSISIGAGVVIPILIVMIIVFIVVFSGLTRKRKRRLAQRRCPQPRIPIVNNATVTATNTQNTAYPMQQSMDQKPPYSNQAPPQYNQPVAAYPTGQYADPQYPTSNPQQPPASYPTSNPQQPPAAYPTGEKPPVPYATGQQPSAPYATGQQPPAQYPTGQQPPAQYPTGQQPPAQYPTGQRQPPAPYATGQQPPAQYFSGGEAPPAYPN